MDDLISRRAVIDAVEKECQVDGAYGYMDTKSIIDMLEDLPAAEPERNWIPVSEKLPENKSYVLTTIKVPGRQPHVRSGWYDGGLFMNDNGDTWKDTDREVIAWMPLPEPYRKEGERSEID